MGLKVRRLSGVQSTLRNTLEGTNKKTRAILKQRAYDTAELAQHLVREDTGQLRKAIEIRHDNTGGRGRTRFYIYINTKVRAAYRTKSGIKYRNKTVASYYRRMNTGRMGWGSRSRIKSARFGSALSVERDRGRYVGDYFIQRAKRYYEPVIISEMKQALRDAAR